MYGCFDVPGLTNCPDGESCQMLDPPTPSNPKPLRTCKKGEQIPNPPTPWYYCT